MFLFTKSIDISVVFMYHMYSTLSGIPIFVTFKSEFHSIVVDVTFWRKSCTFESNLPALRLLFPHVCSATNKVFIMYINKSWFALQAISKIIVACKLQLGGNKIFNCFWKLAFLMCLLEVLIYFYTLNRVY